MSQSKKPLTESIKEHLGKLIDRVELLDVAILFVFYVKYQILDHHAELASMIEAVADLAILKTKTEAGTIAVMLHLGITELPNLANLLDEIPTPMTQLVTAIPDIPSLLGQTPT